MNIKLTTTGRRTGRQRQVVLYGWPDSDRVVIVGSRGGAETDPAWVANLRAEPRAVLHAERTDSPVVAREVTDRAERDRLWQLVTDAFPLYATYQRRTSRAIPLFVLEPDPSARVERMPDELPAEVRSALATGAIFPGSTDAVAAHVAAGDWRAALGLVRAPRRLEVLNSWWSGGSLDVDALRELLPGAWSEATVASELSWWPLFRDAAYAGDPLPEGEPLVAYRGGQPNDPIGLAWSLDRDAAVRNACRWPRAASSVVDGVMVLTGEVVTAELPRAKVVARVERAGVDELIAHPRSVRVVGRERVQTPVR